MRFGKYSIDVEPRIGPDGQMVDLVVLRRDGGEVALSEAALDGLWDSRGAMQVAPAMAKAAGLAKEVGNLFRR